MKNQALFSSKDKSKQLKCHLLQFLFGALRVNSVLSCTVGSFAFMVDSENSYRNLINSLTTTDENT